MAPTAKITEKVPETLPADFCEWDSGSVPGTLPVDFSGFDLAPASDPVSISASATKAQPKTRPEVDRAPVISSSAAEAGYADTRDLFQSIQPSKARSKHEETEDGEQEKKSKALPIAMAAAVLLLAAGALIYTKVLPGKAVAKPAVAAQTPLSGQTNSKPSGATAGVTASGAPDTAAEGANATADTPASEDAASQPRVPSREMMKQLNATSRLSRDIKGGATEAASSQGFAATNIEGLRGNNSVGNVFESHGAPHVSGGQKVGVSAGVARGLLIHKTTPVYPDIARIARHSGTVVLEATISKEGTI